MKSIHNSKRNLSFLIGAMVLLAGASIVIGQTSPTDEYDEWQKAQREAAREHREYLNNPKRSNYLDWRSAQRDAQRDRHAQHEEHRQRQRPPGLHRVRVARSEAEACRDPEKRERLQDLARR